MNRCAATVLHKNTSDPQTDRIRNCGATNSEENEGYGSHKAPGFRRCGGNTVGQCAGPLS